MPSEDLWYLAFDAGIPELHTYWIHETKQWVIYGPTGVYEPVPETAIQEICQNYCDGLGKCTNQKILFLYKRLQNKRWISLKRFDEDPTILNVRNGMLDLSTTPPRFIPGHSPDLLSLVQIHVDYHPDPDPTPCWDKIRAAYPVELFKVERFMQCVFRKDMSNELMLWVYGRTGSGKGTVLSVFNQIYQSCAAHKEIDDIGRNDFGLAGLEGKLLNIELEGTIGWLHGRTVKFLKKIVGLDRTIEVNTKGVRQYDYDFNHLFFVAAYNQLPQLPATDVQAWFRRCWLVAFDKTMQADPVMKNQVLQEASDIFSEIMQLPYHPLKPSNVNAFWRDNMAQWERSSKPVQRIIRELFARGELGDQLAIEEVYGWVEEALVREGQGFTNAQLFKADITNAMSQIGIAKMKKGNGYYYVPAKIIDPALLSRVAADPDRVDFDAVMTSKRGVNMEVPPIRNRATLDYALDDFNA